MNFIFLIMPEPPSLSTWLIVPLNDARNCLSGWRSGWFNDSVQWFNYPHKYGINYGAVYSHFALPAPCPSCSVVHQCHYEFTITFRVTPSAPPRCCITFVYILCILSLPHTRFGAIGFLLIKRHVKRLLAFCCLLDNLVLYRQLLKPDKERPTPGTEQGIKVPMVLFARNESVDK